MDSKGNMTKKAVIKLMTESIKSSPIGLTRKRTEYRKDSPMWSEPALLEILHRYKDKMFTDEQRNKYLKEMNKAIQDYFDKKADDFSNNG